MIKEGGRSSQLGARTPTIGVGCIPIKHLMKSCPIRFGLLFLSCAVLSGAQGQPAPAATAGEGVELDPSATSTAFNQETSAERDSRIRWWREAKFGLFIHWGVYAVPAGSYNGIHTYGEWIMHSTKIPPSDYREFARNFNPVKYDPSQWVRIAQQAGMRYIVITAKHHDGFALYPSDVTDWDIADASPYRRDLLGPLVSAAHGAGLRIGFYYSQAQDWNHVGGAKARFQEGDGWHPSHRGDFDAYLRSVAEPQVRELLTRYPIDILWWDTPTWMNAQRTAPLAALLPLRPGLITNNRLGPGFPGDTATPEQFVPATGYSGDWETCMTMNDHWGYNAADQRWKTSTDLIRKLAEICAKGGNFLLNVGPTAEGEFPPVSVERLQDIGRWLQKNGESIYGTTAGPFAQLSWGVATRKGTRLYLHVYSWPQDGQLRVPLRSGTGRAWLLGAPDQPLETSKEAERVVIGVPASAPDLHSSVVVIELTEEPAVVPLPSAGATAAASSSLPEATANNALDGTAAKRWRAQPEVKSAWLEIVLGDAKTVSGFAMDEPDVWPRLKQRFAFEAKVGDRWLQLADGHTDGHGVTRFFTPLKAQRFRLLLECDAGSPGVAEIQIYQPE